MGKPSGHAGLYYCASALSIAVAMTSLAPCADAQTTTATAAAPAAEPQAQPDVASAAQPEGLGDIVVTARKRSELLRDVPAAVQAISGSELTQKNITVVTDLSATVPNFTAATTSTQPFTFIRGFGSGNNLAFEQSVGKFVDNVSFGRDQDVRIPLFDLERVEVLRGPQVLLFGNSATAGALSVVTKKPGDRLSIDASTGYEFVNDEYQAQGGMTVPVADGVSFRLAGLYDNLARGIMRNTLTGKREPTERDYAIRPTLRLQPTPNLEILLKAEYDSLRSRGGNAQVTNQAKNPIAQAPEAIYDDNRAVNNDVAPFFMKEFVSTDNQLYQGDINYDLLGGKLTSTTAYRVLHVGLGTPNASPLPVFFATIDQRYRQFSQELRFSGSYGGLDATIGAYYQRDNLHAFSAQDFDLANAGLTGPASMPFARVGTFDQLTNSYSGFVDLTYRVTRSLSIEAGVRYTSITKDAAQLSEPANVVQNVTFDTDRSAVLAQINPALAPIYIGVTHSTPHEFQGLHLQEDFFQPQAVVQYKLDSKNMIYAKYVKGDKSGGFDWLYGGTATGATPEGAQFRPEKAESFEVGVKGSLFDNKFEYAIDAFRTTFTDLQVSIFVNSSFQVANVGSARTQGIESEFTFIPTTGLRFNVTASYLDAKYIKFPDTTCTVGQTLAYVPTPAAPSCTQDLSGSRTPFASKWAGTFSVDYEHPVASNYVLAGGVAVTARSDYNVSPGTVDPLGNQKGYALLDAHIDFKPERGWWTLSVFGRNLTNNQFRLYGTAQPAVTGGYITQRSRGRQLGVRLGVRF